MSGTIDGRIQKANNARGEIRRTFIDDRNIGTTLRIQLVDALIGSILLYSLQIIPLNITNISKLQSCYPKCTRIITEGYYRNNDTIVNNNKTRQNNKIPEKESNLKFYRPDMYYSLKNTISIENLNGTHYVNKKLYNGSQKSTH